MVLMQLPPSSFTGLLDPLASASFLRAFKLRAFLQPYCGWRQYDSTITRIASTPYRTGRNLFVCKTTTTHTLLGRNRNSTPRTLCDLVFFPFLFLFLCYGFAVACGPTSCRLYRLSRPIRPHVSTSLCARAMFSHRVSLPPASRPCFVSGPFRFVARHLPKD